MDSKKLKLLIDLVHESGISELELSEGTEKERIAELVFGLGHLNNGMVPPSEEVHFTGDSLASSLSRIHGDNAMGTVEIGQPLFIFA